MHIKLSEQPSAWRKFMVQVVAVAALWFWLLVWRGVIEPRRWPLVMGGLALLGAVAWVRPRWFRGFYRAGMTASGWLGDRVGRVVLTLFFFIVITPLGWGLRVGGYDPLSWRPGGDRRSHWRTPPKSGKLEQMF